MSTTVNKVIVETKTLKLALPPEGFRLVSGEVLPEVEVAYETYGTLAPDRQNAIFICQTLTSDAHAAFYHHPDDREPGWWDDLIGPGKGVDTDRYYVVCANILGGCKGTTGPLSVNPATGRAYGADFPLVEIKDAVRVHKLLLDQLGIPELYAVIGGSLGGVMALEWAVSFPDYVKRCVCIAAAASLSPQALAFDIIARQEIEFDPQFQGGRYRELDQCPAKGLARARQIGHVTYLSSHSMRMKFGRDEREEPLVGEDRSKFCTSFEVERYLHYQGRKLVQRFDANSYLYLTRMIDYFDLEKEYGSLRAALGRSHARFLIVAISSDWLFPPQQQLDLAAALLANRQSVSYFLIDSPYGHDAFLVEYEVLSKGVAAFLNGRPPPLTIADSTRQDVAHVSRLIEGGTRVLDVGAGEGIFTAALCQEKGIEGVCLDRDFAMVVACMAKGLSALQLDADTALSMIAEGAFDCVLLNQTIQQLHSALNTLRQILRIAPCGVIGYPNFACYRYRLRLLFSGRLPVSRTLPYAWYETPNIHLVTARDFQTLCEENGLIIDRLEYLADDALGRLLVRLGLPGLGADRALVRLRRPG